MISTIDWQECERLQTEMEMLSQAPQNAREWAAFREQYEEVAAWPFNLIIQSRKIFLMKGNYPIKMVPYGKRGLGEVLIYNSYFNDVDTNEVEPLKELKDFDRETGLDLCKMIKYIGLQKRY